MLVSACIEASLKVDPDRVRLRLAVVVDDAALAQVLQLEEMQRAAAEQAQQESDAAMAQELAAALEPPPPQQQQEGRIEAQQQAGTVVLEGLLEKKPVRGLGMVERGLFSAGWRARRVVLREDGERRGCCQLEWHHTDEDEAAPSSLLLVCCRRVKPAEPYLGTRLIPPHGRPPPWQDPTSARVRRGGDPGDDAGACLTVKAHGETLVLRCQSVAERDAWLDGVRGVLSRLHAEAYAERVGEAALRLGMIGDEAALRRASRREGG
jgi:hypothetical protein